MARPRVPRKTRHIHGPVTIHGHRKLPPAALLGQGPGAWWRVSGRGCGRARLGGVLGVQGAEEEAVGGTRAECQVLKDQDGKRPGEAPQAQEEKRGKDRMWQGP